MPLNYIRVFLMPGQECIFQHKIVLPDKAIFPHKLEIFCKTLQERLCSTEPYFDHCKHKYLH
jgi:hypothetical protein